MEKSESQFVFYLTSINPWLAVDYYQDVAYKTLLDSLENIVDGNEFCFGDISRLGHLNPIEFTSLPGIARLDDDKSRLNELRNNVSYAQNQTIPIVTFVDLSFDSGTILTAIEELKRMHPFCVFVLYANKVEYEYFLSKLPDNKKYRFGKYFKLLKDNSKGFQASLREVMNHALDTAVQKINTVAYHSVFISYSRKNEDFANWLYRKLKSNLIDCWLDVKEVKAGQKINVEIEKAIDQKDKLLLCSSEFSLNSWWIDIEINAAITKEKNIWRKTKEDTIVLIPLNLDNYLFSESWASGWKSQINSRHAPNFTSWKNHDYEDHYNIDLLVNSLVMEPSQST